jgi:membrane associated rhomboid family serine protease
LRIDALAAGPEASYVRAQQDPAVAKSSEPIFNVPTVVVAVLAVLTLIHVIRVYVLTPDENLQFLLLFSFIPARYDPSLLIDGTLPGGVGAQIWTFVTYALIHANAMHLGMNAVWFIPFGSAVARRFGALRFLAFFAVTAAAGALAHLMAHAGEVFPVIGASAAISGMMAASMRFAFQPGGPLATWRAHDERSYRIPAVSLLTALRDPRVVIFLVVWFGLNILFGTGSLPIAGIEHETVAWEAHIGGFLAGLFLFSAFDPVPKHGSFDNGSGVGGENSGG